jgi:hypothetical protein
MNEFKRKGRTISFRISDEEYASLKLLYRAHGARSLSDFARLSMQRVAALEDRLKSDLLSRIDSLDARVGTLEARLLQNSRATCLAD